MYYASGHYYGSNSTGFLNDEYVLAFSSRSRRDDWVLDNQNFYREIISRREVTTRAANSYDVNVGPRRPRPFSEERWVIAHTHLSRQHGAAGQVVVGTMHDHDTVGAFYG